MEHANSTFVPASTSPAVTDAVTAAHVSTTGVSGSDGVVDSPNFQNPKVCPAVLPVVFV